MPSIDDRKRQKFKKHFEQEKNLASEESVGSVDLPDNVAVDVKRQKNSPGKSKGTAAAEKQRKHLARHVSNTYVRADELKWMLNHSPYIADSGKE